MRTITTATLALAMIGGLALAVPANAQIVNGQNDVNNPLPEAPLGTKGGGSSASMQAPGEKDAAAGAIKNNAEAQNQQPLSANPDVAQAQIDENNNKQANHDQANTDQDKMHDQDRAQNGY